MGLPTGPLAYWLNTAKKLVAPVEGRITHNAWIKNPENAAKLGVTVEEAAKAHPDLVTIRQLGRNTDINPMAEGAMTDAQLKAISEMVQRLELNPATKVRVGDSVGNLYESPSMMDFLGVGRVKDLPQGYGKGGPVKMSKGGEFNFADPKHRQREDEWERLKASANSSSMTEGRAAKPVNPDLISNSLFAAPLMAATGMIGRGSAPAVGRAIPKVAKMIGEGIRTRPAILGGFGLGAGVEALSDDPTVQGALASGLVGAAGMASPIPTMIAQGALHAGDAEAGGAGSLRLIVDAARKMGFHTPVYHGTRNASIVDDILRGKPSANQIDKYLGPHVAADPRVSDAFATKFYAQRPGEKIGTDDLSGPMRIGKRERNVLTIPGGNILPLTIRGEYKSLPTDAQFGTGGLGSDLLRLAITDPEKYKIYLQNWLHNSSHGWMDAVDSEKILSDLIKGDSVEIGVLRGNKEGNFYFPTRRIGDPSDYLGRPIKTNTVEVNSLQQLIDKNPNKVRTSSVATPEEEPIYRMLADAYKNELNDSGFSGIKYINQSMKEVPVGSGYDPTSFIITDPAALRSMFAKFNPADVNKTGLGLAQGGTVEAPTESPTDSAPDIQAIITAMKAYHNA
jgi:hypothetical protein